MKEHGFELNKEKCLFYKKEIKVFENIISSDGIRPIPSKLVPCVLKEFQSFLGLIKNFGY